MNKGFFPVMLTPFSENGNIDFDGLSRLIEYYLIAGARGLFANCLSSEMFDLTEKERLKIVQHVVKVSNGAVPIVATGTFDVHLNKKVEFIKKLYDLGTHAVIIVPSIMAAATESDEILNDRIGKLLDLTDNIPVGFYECPAPYKRLISVTQLKQFLPTRRLIYHKDTSLDLGQVKEKITAGTGYDFGLYEAYMVNAVDSLQAGAAGLSCIQGNYFPKLVTWLCRNYNKPELGMEIKKVRDFFTRNMDIMHAYYPLSAKYFARKHGLNITTRVRTGIKLLSSEVKSKMDELYKNYLVLEKDLQLKENR